MQNAFEIKGIRIGDGKPVICVPVVAPERETIIETIKSLTEQKVQMIEWRVDCFREADDVAAVRAVLDTVKTVPHRDDFPVYVPDKAAGWKPENGRMEDPETE